MTDPEVIRQRMEAIGEDEVRRQLASGNIPTDMIASTQLWLGKKEAERKALSERAVQAADLQAQHSGTANILSAFAIFLSVLALLVSLFALFRHQ